MHLALFAQYQFLNTIFCIGIVHIFCYTDFGILVLFLCDQNGVFVSFITNSCFYIKLFLLSFDVMVSKVGNKNPLKL